MANMVIKRQIENYSLEEIQQIDEILAWIKDGKEDCESNMPIKRNSKSQDETKKEIDSQPEAKKKKISNLR
jgi:hypothetical protein